MRIRNKWTFPIKVLIMFLAILAFVPPAFFRTQLGPIGKLWHYYAGIAFYGILMFMFIRHCTYRNIWKILPGYLLYGWIALSTVLHNGLIKGSILQIIFFTYGYLLSTVYMQRDKYGYIRMLRNILLVFFLINFLTIILFPNGLYTVARTFGYEDDNRYWFLGFKNGIPKYGLVLTALCALNYQNSRDRKDLRLIWLSVVTTVLSSVLIQSSSGLVSSVLYTFLIWLTLREKKSKIADLCRMRNYVIVVCIAFIGLVLTTKLLENQFLQYFITQVLGEKLTLSGRTLIWARVFEIIRQGENFLFGIGYLEESDVARIIGITRNTVDAHNFYLEVLLEGGIIGFILMIVLFARFVIVLDRYRNHSAAKVLSAFMFCIMIVFIVENTSMRYIWIIFGICANIDILADSRYAMIGIPPRDIPVNLAHNLGLHNVLFKKNSNKRRRV